MLTAAAAPGEDSYSHSYAYDPLGNITSFDGVAYGYNDSAHRHAVTHLGAVAPRR